jgi:hypothetical protein
MKDCLITRCDFFGSVGAGVGGGGGVVPYPPGGASSNVVVLDNPEGRILGILNKSDLIEIDEIKKQDITDKTHISQIVKFSTL